MRSYPSCWNKTLTKLGFKRVLKKHKPKKLQLGRRSLIEQLEPRQMLAADTYVVSTLEDVAIAGTSTDDQWSLREALAHSASDGNHAGERDTIKFAPLLWGGTVELDAAIGQLVVNSDMTIEGPGTDLLTINALGNSRVLSTQQGNDITLQGLTITGGLINSHGGGIYNKANLVLEDVALRGNRTTGNLREGGALASWTGDVSLLNSVISDNATDSLGGGIFFRSYEGQKLTIVNTTFHDNEALSRNGGAITIYSWTNPGAIDIINSTFSGNRAERGGALFAPGYAQITILNSTITNNIASEYGGGIANSQNTASIELHNTIVAGNISSVVADAEGPFESNSSHNLIGVTNSNVLKDVSQDNQNEHGVTDVGLLPLGDYGGPTPTHALTADSPAIDKGNNSFLSLIPSDGEHYLDRLVDSSDDGIANPIVDIGAQEYGAKPIVVDDPFRLDTEEAASSAYQPWTTTNEIGQTAVTWLGRGQEGDGVYAQIINPDGSATSQARRVDAGYGQFTGTARVAIDREGRFAVAWRETIDGDARVYLRRYHSDGTPVDLLPVLLNPEVPAAYSSPSIVANASGQLIVSWQSAGGDLMFRRLTTSGLSLDSAPRLGQASEVTDVEFPENSRSELKTGTSGRYAAITEDGSFYLFWTQETNYGEGGFLQHFSSAGQRVGDEQSFAAINGSASDTNELEGGIAEPNFQLTAGLTAASLTPFDILVDSQGNVIVTWHREAEWSLDSAGESDLYRSEGRLSMRYYDSQSGWQTPITVSQVSGIRFAGEMQGWVEPRSKHSLALNRPGLAVDRLGRVGIAWQESLVYEVDNMNEAEITQLWQEAAYTGPTDIQGAGSSSDILLRWYENDGSPYSNTTIDTDRFGLDTNIAADPSLSSNGVGEFIVIGRVDNSIYAQRFQLTKPIELVDGQLRINDVYSQFKDIALATTPIDGVRYVTFNDQVTDILASEVTSIDVTAGTDSNRIDLSRVSLDQFPSLVIDDVQGAITIRGGAGDDTIFGTALNDFIFGSSGNDEIFGGEGIDIIYGDEGDDSLLGGEGNDILQGGAGDDRLFGGDGADYLSGGEGDDRLFGQEGSDNLTGNSGNDLLDGGTGLQDTLQGHEGDDRYVISNHSAAEIYLLDVDLLGIDTIDLSQASQGATLDISNLGTSQSVFVDVSLILYQQGSFTTHIENVVGTRLDDQLTGNDLPNVLRGGLGDDTLSGGDGADELLGEGGDDILDPGATPTDEVDLLVGGFGNDIYVLSDGVTTTARINDEAGTDKIDLSTWTGPEGATLDLSLTPEDAAYQTVLEENDSPKLRLVNSGLDAIEEIIGSDNDDILTGNDHDNLLAGGKGSDALTGQGGNNVLLGQEGYDAIEVADNVNDTLDTSIVYSESSTTWLDATGGFHGTQRVTDNSVAATASWSFSELPRGDYDVYVTWSVPEGEPGSSAVYSIGSESITVNQAENPTGSVTGGAAWHRLENTQTNSGGRFTVDSSGDLTVTLAHDAVNLTSELIYADAVRVVRRNQAPTITVGTPAAGNGTIGGAVWEVDNVAELEITVGDGDEDAASLVLDDSLTSVPGVSLDRVGMTAVWKLSYDGTTLDKTHAIILQVADGTDTTTKTLYIRDTNSSNPISIDSFTPSEPVDGYLINEANADVNDPDKTLSVTVAATVSTGTPKFSLGPGAPAGASIDASGLLTWSPTEDQDGTHQIEVRVTDSGNPPLRVSQWITVHVADINDDPKLELSDSLKLQLKRDTIGTNGTNDDGTTADATLEGWVRNDGAVDLIEIEVDYDYDPNTPTVFTADEVIQVEVSDDDPTLGNYTIYPDEFDLVLNASNHVAVQAREWLGASGGTGTYLYSSIQYVTFTPDPDAHDPPTFESGSLKLSNDTGSTPNNTIDPTIEGTITNDGSVEGLTIHFFSVVADSNNYPNHEGRPSYGSTETDADGKFSFLPEGLLDGVTGNSKPINVWVVVEERSPLDISAGSEKFSLEDTSTELNFTLHKQIAPTVNTFEIHPDHNTGDPNDTTTSAPWLRGSIDDSDPNYHGPTEGVIIQFSEDADFAALQGATITDANGNFEYLPVGIEYQLDEHDEPIPTTIHARAVAWNDYQQESLQGIAFDPDPNRDPTSARRGFTFTYDETENSPATILSLDLKYDRNADDIVVDPAIKGAIGNDGPEEAKAGMLVEFSIVPFDPLGTSADFDNPTGVAVTDENGEFEYTPFDLEANLQYDVYARVIEWDGLRGTHSNNEALLIGDPSAPLSLTISSDAEPPATLTSYGLKYNTGGDNSGEKTADPTVAGTVEYDGDMQNVIVELSLGGTNESIVQVTPDELGNFQYTMPGLIDDEVFDIQARVRVPDYTAKAPEFEDAWLNVDSEGLLSADGYLIGYTFDNPETEVDESGWSQDADGNGVPDITDAWLNDLFVGDGTELGGAWYDSGFTRDWENLFEDYTTEWTSLDRDLTTEGLQQYELDLGDTNPFFIQLDPQSDSTDPTISGGLKRVGGTEIDNAQREGIAIEISFDGGTEFEAAAVTDADGNFSYQLPSYVVGVNTVNLRFLRPQYGADAVPDGEIAASLTIEADDTLPTPTLELKHPRDEDGNSSALDAIDPTVIGDLDDATDVSLRRVQFEYSSNGTTWDGLPDGSVFTDNDGNFEFTPEAIESYLTVAGNMDRNFAIRARVVEKVTSDTAEPYEYEAFGEWSDVLQFKSTVNQSSTIESFELAFDTGLNDEAYETLDRVTSDPTLVGRVMDSDNTGHANATVEFSLDGGTTIAGTTLTDGDGTFYYQPEGLTAGYHDIVVRVQEYDPVKGSSIDDGWQPLTATGDPSDTLGLFTGFTLTEPSPAIVSHLEQVDLSNSGYDPTLTGHITDPDTVENVTIDFYRDPSGENEYLGSTRVDRDGTFSFTPVGLAFGANIAIKAIPKEVNYLTGDTLEGTELVISGNDGITFSPKTDFTVLVPTLSQADDFYTLVATSKVTAPLDANNDYETVAPQYVEVAILDSNDALVHRGIAEIEFKAPTNSTSAPEYSYTYEYDLREDGLASDSSLKVIVRPVGVDEDGYVFGNEKEKTTGYEFPVVQLNDENDPQVALSGSQVVGNDGSMLRPSLAGEVGLDFFDTMPYVVNHYSQSHEVEIDYDGDGFADATVFLEAGETDFEYAFEGLEPGKVSLFVRAITTLEKLHTTGGEKIQRIEGAWQPIEFTLANPAPLVTPPTDPEPPSGTPDPRLRLLNPRDVVEEIPVASDPTIVGTITTALLANPNAETPDPTTVPIAGMTVEIDHNSDGVADGTTTVDSEGRFEYTPTGLPVGNVTLSIRAIDYYSDTQPLVGDWLEFRFELAEMDPPAVSLLELERSEGTRDVSDVDLPVSTYPVLTGTVDVPEGVGQVIVEFDHDDDDLADGSTNTDLFGAFNYTPEGLSHGPTTVRARAVLVNGSERVIGLWSDELATDTSLTFYHASAEPAVVTDLWIEDIDENGESKSGVITGRVTVGGYGQAVKVAVSIVGETEPNGYTYADSNGFFRYQLQRITRGLHEIEVEGLLPDPSGAGDVPGKNKPKITINYQPGTIITPSSSEVEFRLEHDTGTVTTHTANPALFGKIPTASLTTQAYAQIKLSTESFSNDPNDWVRIRPDGTFTYLPAGLDPDVAYTFDMRVAIWNPDSAGDLYVDSNPSWTTSVNLTVDVTDNTAAWITDLKLRNNTDPNGPVAQSAEPIFVGTIENDGRKGGLTVEFDHNGDGVVDGTTLTREDGSFLYHAVGLEPGELTQTITALVRETDYYGNERTSTIASLDFILTRAPLVEELRYYSNSIYGELHYPVAVATGDLKVEYYLFGSAFDRPELAEDWWSYGNYQLSTESQYVADADNGTFTIDLSNATYGSASVLVRGVDLSVSDEPLHGPWQVLHFEKTNDFTNYESEAIAELSFSESDETANSTDPDYPLVTDAAISGRAAIVQDNGGGPEVLGGIAYGIVQLEVFAADDQTGTPLTTQRVTTDRDGYFQFSPNLGLGQYRYELRMVHFNEVTQSETTSNYPTIKKFQLTDGTTASISSFGRLAAAADDDPTVEGTIDNPDGRQGGLRVEFSTGIDTNEAIIGATITRPDGTFSFTPHNLNPGTITLYARVVDWDPVTSEYSSPDFTQASVASGEVKQVQFDLLAGSTEQPELDGTDSQTPIYVQETLRGLVSSTLDELESTYAIKGKVTTTGTLDLGFGEATLLAGDDIAEGGLAPLEVYPANTNFSLATLSVEAPDGTHYPVDASVNLGGGYISVSLLREVVDHNNDTFSINYLLYLEFHGYETTQTVPDGNGGTRDVVIELNGNYRFSFATDSPLAANAGGTYSGTYDQFEEDVEFAYDVRPYSTGDPLPIEARGSETFIHELDPNETGTFSTASGVTHQASHTETNRREEQRNDTVVVTNQFGNQLSTVTTATVENIIVVETITRTGELGSSGIITNLISESYDAYATVDSQVTVSTSYQTLYDGQGESENGSDTFTNGLLYTGSISVDTTYSGDTETSNFTLNENSYATVNFSGSGSSSTVGAGGSAGSISRSETWHYGGNGFTQESSQIGGTAIRTGTGSNTIDTLQASGSSNSSFYQTAHGGGSGTFDSNSGPNNSTSGSGGGTFLQTSSGSGQRSATINAVDEVFTIIGSGSGQSSASTSSTSNGTSSSTSTSDTGQAVITTNANARSQQAGGGSVSTRGNYTFKTTDQGQRVTGNFGISLDVNGSSGTSVTGTTSVNPTDDPSYTVPFNDSSAGSYGLVVSHQGSYTVDTLGDEPINKSSGTVKRTETTGSRSSRFGGVAGKIDVPAGGGGVADPSCNVNHGPGSEHGCQDEPGQRYLSAGLSNFSLTKGTRDIISSEEYDYSTDGSATTRRGTFDNTDRSTSETIDQFQFDEFDEDGNGLSYKYRSDSGGSSNDTTSGPFSETPRINGSGGRTAEVNGTTDQQGNSAEEISFRYTSPGGTTGNSSFSSGYSNRKGQSQSDGSGSSSIDNDEVTQNGGEGSFQGNSRVGSGGTSFAVYTSPDGKNYSSSFSTGSGTGDARGNGNSQRAGGNDANQSGSASARTNTSSKGHGNTVEFSISTDPAGVTTITKVISNGKNNGGSKGDSSGEITTGDDVFDVSSEQGGGSEGSTTQTIDRFGNTFRSHSSYTSFGDSGGKRGFGGDVIQREGGGSLRDGTVIEEGNGSGGGFGKDYHFSIDLSTGSVSWERTVFDNENGGNNDSSTEVDDRSGDQTGSGSVEGNVEDDYTQTGGTFKLIPGGFTLSTYKNTHETNSSLDTSGGFSLVKGKLTYTEPSVTESTEERTKNEKWFKQRKATNDGDSTQDDLHHVDRTWRDTFSVTISQTDDQEPLQTEITTQYHYSVDLQRNAFDWDVDQYGENYAFTQLHIFGDTHETNNKSTYTLQGDQETLVISNKQVDTIIDGYKNNSDELGGPGANYGIGEFQPSVYFAGVGGKDYLTTDATEKSSNYRSSHTLTDKGLATNGSLTASSKMSRTIHSKGEQDTPWSIPDAPQAGSYEKYRAYAYVSDFEQKTVLSEEIKESGGYYDTASGKRVGWGTYTVENHESLEASSDSKDYSKEWLQDGTDSQGNSTWYVNYDEVNTGQVRHSKTHDQKQIGFYGFGRSWEITVKDNLTSETLIVSLDDDTRRTSLVYDPGPYDYDTKRVWRRSNNEPLTGVATGSATYYYQHDTNDPNKQHLVNPGTTQEVVLFENATPSDAPPPRDTSDAGEAQNTVRAMSEGAGGGEGDNDYDLTETEILFYDLYFGLGATHDEAAVFAIISDGAGIDFASESKTKSFFEQRASDPNSAWQLRKGTAADQSPGAAAAAKQLGKNAAAGLEAGLLALPGGTVFELGQLAHGQDARGKEATASTYTGVALGVLGLKKGAGAADELLENVDNAAKAGAKAAFGKPTLAFIKKAVANRGSLRAALGLKRGDPRVAHHLIPIEALGKFGELLEKGARGGFNINGANNGRALRRTEHVLNHPQYNRAVLDELGRIEDQVRVGGLSDNDAAELLQGAANKLGEAIDNGTYGPWG